VARGGFRAGAGRPKKSSIVGKAAGLAGSPAKPGVPAKFSKDNLGLYFEAALRECADVLPTVAEIRADIEAYVERMGCAAVVAPQLITDYIINRQGFLACEGINRKLGRTTSGGKVSPYVSAAQAYYKAMREDFSLITQIVFKYKDDGGGSSQNAFLDMLVNRGF
jgi:hypothetical protein